MNTLTANELAFWAEYEPTGISQACAAWVSERLPGSTTPTVDRLRELIAEFKANEEWTKVQEELTAAVASVNLYRKEPIPEIDLPMGGVLDPILLAEYIVKVCREGIQSGFILGEGRIHKEGAWERLLRNVIYTELTNIQYRTKGLPQWADLIREIGRATDK